MTKWQSPGGQKGANLGQFGPILTFLGRFEPIDPTGWQFSSPPQSVLEKIPLKQQKTVENEIKVGANLIYMNPLLVSGSVRRTTPVTCHFNVEHIYY